MRPKQSCVGERERERDFFPASSRVLLLCLHPQHISLCWCMLFAMQHKLNNSPSALCVQLTGRSGQELPLTLLFWTGYYHYLGFQASHQCTYSVIIVIIIQVSGVFICPLGSCQAEKELGLLWALIAFCEIYEETKHSWLFVVAVICRFFMNLS